MEEGVVGGVDCGGTGPGLLGGVSGPSVSAMDLMYQFTMIQISLRYLQDNK